jgi:DNA mismatch repair ATPase MutS
MNIATRNSIASQGFVQIAPDHPDHIVFILMGQDLLTFDSDAIKVSDALGLKLGQHADGSPLIIIPMTQNEMQLGKLINKGYKLIIAEQELIIPTRQMAMEL